MPASAEAEALGLRLARVGTLATLLPLMISKETDEIVQAYSELSATDRNRLSEVARRIGEQAKERAMRAEGHAYAGLLSVDDLRKLVWFGESELAARQRAIHPKVVMATMAKLDGFDFKKEVESAFCQETGKTCAGTGKSTVRDK